MMYFSITDDPSAAMFSGYSDVARYCLDSDMHPSDSQSEPCPGEYLPVLYPSDPWASLSVCSQDFVLIAEFSEQEGPKPLVSTALIFGII